MTMSSGEGPRRGPFEVYEFPDVEEKSQLGPYATASPRAGVRHGPGFSDWLSNGFDSARALVSRCDNSLTRGLARFFTGLVPGAPGLASLLQLPDAASGDERLICLGVAAVSAVALVLLLRRPWFNAGRGILFGAGLWLLSGLWWNSIVFTAAAVWQYVMASDGSEAGDLGEFAFGLVIGAGVFVACTIGLKRLDPDF
jgi:hypothetical protein